MKIIHLCNYFQPELGYQEYFLAKEHIKSGNDVTVITSERYFPFPDYNNTVSSVLGKRIIKAGKFVYEGIKLIRLNILFEFQKRVFLKGLKKEIYKINPDIVICHGISNFNAMRIIRYKKKLRFKLFFDEHMHFSEINRRLTGKLFYKFFNFKNILKSGDRFIGISPECREFMIRYYKFPENKVEMIPLGADSELFKFNENNRLEMRRKFFIDTDEVVIVYAGKMTEKKGPHNILKAMSMIKDKINKKICLLFVGNYEEIYKEFFLKSADEITGKGIKIINIPAVENRELTKIYSASDIGCWPREASNSMIEASSCSLPIICTDFLPERYKNHNGIPVKEDDIKALADALYKLITEPVLRREMGTRGRELIERELSWKLIAERFIK